MVLFCFIRTDILSTDKLFYLKLSKNKSHLKSHYTKVNLLIIQINTKT